MTPTDASAAKPTTKRLWSLAEISAMPRSVNRHGYVLVYPARRRSLRDVVAATGVSLGGVRDRYARTKYGARSALRSRLQQEAR